MGKSSFFGDGNIHRESTLVLYSASTRLTDGGRIMVRTAAFVLGSQMTTSDPTMLACLSIRSSPLKGGQFPQSQASGKLQREEFIVIFLFGLDEYSLHSFP